jgi:hypothetical protein
MKTTINRSLVTITFVLLILGQMMAQAQAQTFRIWSALRVGTTMKTSYDIQEYIRTTKISENTHRSLFRLAEGDWNRYQELVGQVVDESFEAALNEVAYGLLLEHMATRNLRRGETRQAFTVTTEEYNKTIQERENEVLREWLDQRLGIVVARREFGKKLKETGYPHRDTETHEDIYWRWYKTQQELVKHALHRREVNRFEQIRAMTLSTDRRYRPLAISDLYRELENHVQTELQGLRLTPREVAEIQRSKPEIGLVINSINLLSLSGAPMSRIAQTPEVGAQKLRESLALIRNDFNQAIGSERVDRILHYEEMAAMLAQRHNDVERLRQLSRQREEAFVRSANHNDFMMSKLYDLAIIQLQQNPDRNQVRTNVQNRMTRGLEWLRRENQTGQIYLQESVQNLLFEDSVARVLRQNLNVEQITDAYERAVTDMAIWVVRFEAKRVSFQDEAIVHVDVAQLREREVYQRIDNHLQREMFLNGLERFHREELPRHSYMLQITPFDGPTIRGQDALRAILP